MNKKIAFTLFAMIIVAFVAITIKGAPVKTIHPDALRFMAIFQQQYDTVNSVSDAPLAFFRGIRRAHEYDYYRGRLTNYVAFGLDAMTRSYLPLPFVSWLTILVVILNASLLAHLTTKNISTTSLKQLLFILTVLALLLNPTVIASYEMQFIYSKYLCVTFMLLFMIFSSPGLRAASLVGAIFSDEIGVAFAMIAVFLIIVNAKLRADENSKLAWQTYFRATILGIMGGLTVLLFYFATMLLLFHHISKLILKGGFGIKSPSPLIKIGNSLVSLYNIMSIELSKFGFAIIFMIACVWCYNYIKKIHFSSLLKQIQKIPLRACIVDRHVQVMCAAIFMVLFITYKMYLGGIGWFYYSYPVYMLIMFVLLSLFMRSINQRFLAVALTALVLSLVINLPNGFALIRNEAASVWIVDKTVSLESFYVLENAINEVKDKNGTFKFDTIDNGQDLFKPSDTYGEKYFPSLGMVEVLSWPHKIDRCATN